MGWTTEQCLEKAEGYGPKAISESSINHSVIPSSVSTIIALFQFPIYLLFTWINIAIILVSQQIE